MRECKNFQLASFFFLYTHTCPLSGKSIVRKRQKILSRIKFLNIRRDVYQNHLVELLNEVLSKQLVVSEVLLLDYRAKFTPGIRTITAR